jgi:hypothetical protein
MAGKKRKKYTLDDIDFVGTQDKGSPAQVKKDIERTIQYFKDLQAGKLKTQPAKSKGRLTKVK